MDEEANVPVRLGAFAAIVSLLRKHIENSDELQTHLRLAWLSLPSFSQVTGVSLAQAVQARSIRNVP